MNGLNEKEIELLQKKIELFHDNNHDNKNNNNNDDNNNNNNNNDIDKYEKLKDYDFDINQINQNRKPYHLSFNSQS